MPFECPGQDGPSGLPHRSVGLLGLLRSRHEGERGVQVPNDGRNPASGENALSAAPRTPGQIQARPQIDHSKRASERNRRRAHPFTRSPAIRREGADGAQTPSTSVSKARSGRSECSTLQYLSRESWIARSTLGRASAATPSRTKVRRTRL